MMWVPVSRYSLHVSSSGCHSESMRSNAFSSDHSFEATPEISSSFSRCPSRFIPITEVSVVESVGLNG